MGFEPTTLCDLVRYSTTELLETLNKGQIVTIDWNRIARLHSHMLAHMNSLTASRCHNKVSARVKKGELSKFSISRRSDKSF